MQPTGQQITLSGGGYAATITEVGATLRELTHAGRPLVRGFAAEEPMPDFRGALLAPWPNRIGDGRYDFDGRGHQLAISEPGRGTALHGLVAWQAWRASEHGEDAATFETVLWPQRGYPFLLTLTASYRLGPDGLAITVTARNDSDTAAPFGTSMHPWFVAGDGGIADWRLTLPADRVLTTDQRLLPTGEQDVGGELDFRAGRPLGETRIDHAFTAVRFAGRRATATLLAPDGRGVAVSWDDSCRWVQVCTGDEGGPEVNRRAVAIEPMTCPPDAFRTGIDVVRLAPGATFATGWQITAVG